MDQSAIHPLTIKNCPSKTSVLKLILRKKQNHPKLNYIRLVKNVLFSDFENTVNANREAAERALIEVDRINEIIQQAKEKTDQAREAMTGADTSAQLALNVALEGEKIVKEPSEKASLILRKRQSKVFFSKLAKL